MKGPKDLTLDFVWTDGKNEEFQRFYIKNPPYDKLDGAICMALSL